MNTLNSFLLVWSKSDNMISTRFEHTATVLQNGKVLVAGGHNGSHVISSAELYDPSTGTWTATGSMSYVRFRHTASLLANGKVLVAGGFDINTSLRVLSSVANSSRFSRKIPDFQLFSGFLPDSGIFRIFYVSC